MQCPSLMSSPCQPETYSISAMAFGLFGTKESNVDYLTHSGLSLGFRALRPPYRVPPPVHSLWKSDVSSVDN